MNAAKHERFIKVANKRMDVLIEDFRKLSKCACTTTYEYTSGEVDQIITELERQINLLKDRFHGKTMFTLKPERDDTPSDLSSTCNGEVENG